MKIAYLDILYDGNDAFEELASELNRHAPEGVHVDYHFVTGTDNLEYMALFTQRRVRCRYNRMFP